MQRCRIIRDFSSVLLNAGKLKGFVCWTKKLTAQQSFDGSNDGPFQQSDGRGVFWVCWIYRKSLIDSLPTSKELSGCAEVS